ncbi:hypothetical protein ACH5RR_012050 [Cinchona calisaya]|uniref:Uncharacterized protein n=1 Tax=Cinchona calisaya TaxID=153742 RepID=A0ABD3A6S4_9GENT
MWLLVDDLIPMAKCSRVVPLVVCIGDGGGCLLRWRMLRRMRRSGGRSGLVGGSEESSVNAAAEGRVWKSKVGGSVGDES